MCGIAGELNWASGGSASAVEALVNGILHRGPDDRGVWISPSRHCVLGHARLSVIDLSPAGHQPMVDAVAGNAITFNGEIYNFRELRRKCEGAGDSFVSQSDTEVILALYRRYGTDCLKYLRGMFAFAIWDEKHRTLFVARDRVGKKPLNYALTPGGIVFCSELAPLSRHAAVDVSMDTEALDLYLQSQYIPAPWTIYRGIRKLPPAHFALFNVHGLKLEQYWSVDYRQKIRVNEQDALDALEDKLSEAVKQRMISDVPIGALLSGGVDSSVVVALMAKLSQAPIRTFSIGFDQEAYNELPYAQQVANTFKTAHSPEVVSGNVENLLPLVAKRFGEPHADHSAIPSFFVSAAARRHVTVVLNGDGGDELLGGYPHYSLSRSQVCIGGFLGNSTSPNTLFEKADELVAACSAWDRVQRKLIFQFLHPELRSTTLFGGGFNGLESASLLHNKSSKSVSHAWWVKWLAECREHANNPVDRMLWIDNQSYLPNDLLVKMDIASMHCGLEARSPFLDHELIEFCASLPVAYKVRNSVGKYLLKRLAERYFPRHFVYRRKMGFSTPLAYWLRGPLRNAVHDVIRDPIAMRPLNQLLINRFRFEFYESGVDHSLKIWTLLMFGVWNRAWADARRQDGHCRYSSTPYFHE